MKTYIVQTARGAQADTAEAKWQDVELCGSLDQARDAAATIVGAKADAEDRGDEYAAEWDRLIEQAKTVNVGYTLAFDEFAVRIIEDANS